MTDRVIVAGEQPYEVVVGAGALAELAALVPADVRRVAVVHQAAVSRVVDDVEKAVSGRVEVLRIEVPDGEGAKSAAVVVEAWDSLAAQGFTRSDLIVGVGGIANRVWRRRKRRGK